MKKIYVVGEAKYYASFIKDAVLVEDIEKADIVLFTGGEDVHPDLYNEKKHQTSYCNKVRDLFEQEVFEAVSDNKKILKLGICRGLI